MNRSTSSILTEHNKVIRTKYILAIVNYVFILTSTLITLYFMKIKGAPSGITVHIYALIAVNGLQILICAADFILTRLMGIYAKFLTWISWGLGVIWIAVWIGAFVAGTLELGSVRIDLLAIAAVQFIMALFIYVIWSVLDRKAIDAMINVKVRGDEKLRESKAKSYVRVYLALSVIMVFVQAATLFSYKVPPTVYDLFDDTRAVKYELNEAGAGYVVTGTYLGTSTRVNIPATYNNKPVVGIASGGISDEGDFNEYKITSISFGTPETQADGTVNISAISNISKAKP